MLVICSQCDIDAHAMCVLNLYVNAIGPVYVDKHSMSCAAQGSLRVLTASAHCFDYIRTGAGDDG